MNAVSAAKITSLLEANRILSSTLDFHELLRQVMRLAADVVDAETASILLYDAARHDLSVDAALGAQETALKTIRIPLGSGIAGWVAKERTSQIINDVAADPRWSHTADHTINFTTRSIIAAPLLCKGVLLGVIEGLNKKSGVFDAGDLSLFEAFAAQAAVAIENARLFNGITEERNKLSTVFLQMSDGAVYVDAQGRSLLVNAAARAVLGDERAAADTLEHIFADYTVVPPLSDVMAATERLIPVECARTAGKALFLAGIASHVRDDRGAIHGLLLMFRDVTLQKREELIKRNFLSLISHKLKTPLVAITGYGPLLLADDSLTESHKKIIGSIHRQGMHLASLVDKLLYYTMIESDTLSLALTRAPMDTVVDTAIAGIKNYCDEHHAVVTVDESIARMPAMMMDSEKIVSVERNLVENAVKFNRSEIKQVTISARLGTGLAGVAVRDNGVGIPPEERARIFEKFYQIEEAFTGQVEGAGLGLALVKQVVEAHGGTVGVGSAPDGGSIVYFMVPVQPEGE